MLLLFFSHYKFLIFDQKKKKTRQILMVFISLNLFFEILQKKNLFSHTKFWLWHSCFALNILCRRKRFIRYVMLMWFDAWWWWSNTEAFFLCMFVFGIWFVNLFLCFLFFHCFKSKMNEWIKFETISSCYR